jgi:hypothetical protein
MEAGRYRRIPLTPVETTLGMPGMIFSINSIIYQFHIRIASRQAGFLEGSP